MQRNAIYLLMSILISQGDLVSAGRDKKWQTIQLQGLMSVEHFCSHQHVFPVFLASYLAVEHLSWQVSAMGLQPVKRYFIIPYYYIDKTVNKYYNAICIW